MCEIKCNKWSDILRAEGNKMYNERRFHNAMLKYNESLCFAEAGSENVGLAYANRSAVYFEMKLYDKCLKNVMMAKMNGYPEKNFEILEKRDEKCRELMGKRKEILPIEVFKLSHPPNKKLPFIIDCLELKSSPKFGRYIITSQPLKVGDIVSMEEAYYSVLSADSEFAEIPQSNIFQRCSNCLKDNSLDLIPCETCCKAMFCSVECYQTALKRYHRYECPVMDQLLRVTHVHLGLRLLFIALSTFGDSIEELQTYLKENENRDLTIFDVNLRSEDCDKELLLGLKSLIKSTKGFSLAQHEEILRNHPQLQEVWASHKNFIRNFLHVQCQIADLNVHGIFSGSSRKFENAEAAMANLQQPIGSGSFLFSARVNHSCASNVSRIFFGGKVVLFVCRPIAKGSQLFDCYKSTFTTQLKPERQQRLLKEFGFTCECEACVSDFPTPPALKTQDMKLMKFAKKSEQDIRRLPPNQAMRKFRECCEAIEKNHRNFPSIELCILQKCIATFLITQAQPLDLFS